MKSMATTGLVLATAFFASAGAFGQCDPISPGNFTDTQFDSGADCNSGYDDNGGWNETGNPFLEAGVRQIGDSFRVKGIVGTYDNTCTGADDNARDLDWVRFSVSEFSYITVTLQMADAYGANVDGTEVYDLLFIEQGSDSNTAIDLYGEYGTDGCPHWAVYTFANGTQQAQFPVEAGDILIIVTTAFSSSYADPAQMHGPLSYGLDVSVVGIVEPNCGAATNDCRTQSPTGGCSDGVCCDLICGFIPSCCDTAWDAACVAEAESKCFESPPVCLNPNPSIPNDCFSDAELVLGLPAFISFDCTDAETDGPNDVSRLCVASTAHDVWYIVGPAPYAGELLVTLCGLGNTGDAVISVFDLGTTSDIGNPQDLASKYLACRDDDCDDDGDGNVDLAGPCGINLLGVPAGEFLLIRVGSFLDPENPNAPGFAGSLQMSFRAVFAGNGLQRAVSNAGTNTNLGLISGWSTAALPKRWSMVPFEMHVAGSVNGFDFAAFDNVTPDQVEYKIISRSPAASYGNFGRPFGDGNYVESQVIASGTEPLDMNVFSNIGDDYQQRFFIDLSSPFQLDAGSYYFCIYGSKSDGSGASFAWLLFGSEGMSQATTTSVIISAAESASATSQGTFPSGTPFGWRSTGTGPKFCFYNLGPAYSVPPGYDPGQLYQCAFNLKGIEENPCYGDLDGSGEVDGGDIGLVLLDFGPCPGCLSDMDGSGEVDGGDIGLVLLSFGACQ